MDNLTPQKLITAMALTAAMLVSLSPAAHAKPNPYRRGVTAQAAKHCPKGKRPIPGGRCVKVRHARASSPGRSSWS